MDIGSSTHVSEKRMYIMSSLTCSSGIPVDSMSWNDGLAGKIYSLSALSKV